MHAPHFLAELLLLIGFAAAGVAIFERLRLPAIGGFLVIGALAGPNGLALVADPDQVRQLAELGVVFLLFEIGLELPVDRVRRLWRTAALAGAVQVAATLVLVAAGLSALGLDGPQALLVGALVAMSSTAVVMRLLSDQGEVDAPHGRLIVGILLFQDLCIVPFLLAVPLLAGGVAPEPAAVAFELGRALLALALFAVAARFGLPALLDRAARLRSRELFSLLALLVVVGSAVAAEEIGLTLAVGAFVGGLVTGSTPYSHQLFAEVGPLRGVFLGLFFTAVGMLFDPGSAVREWELVLGYVTGVVLLKAGIVAALVVWVLRHPLRVGVMTGLALAQTGEFSFVLAGVAAAAGLLEPGVQQVFVAGSVLTLLATPFLVRAAPHLATRLAALADQTGAPDEPDTAALAGHVVLVGFGIAGRNLARVLRALGRSYVAVDTNPESVREATARGEPVIYGDATRRRVLERVRVRQARAVVVATSDPRATEEVVSRCHELAPEATLLARTRFVLEVDALQSRGAQVVVAEELEGTIDLLAGVLRVLEVPEGAIARFTGELREEGYEPLREPPGLALDPWLAELLEQVAPDWIEVPQDLGEALTPASLELRARTGANLLAVERGDLTTPNPPPDFTLQGGDRLLLFGSAAALRRVRDLLDRHAGPG